MSRRRIVLIVLAVAAAAAGIVLLMLPSRNHPLVLSGTIEARDVSVGSLVGGRVLSVQADEGASVKAGQPLVTLEPDLLDRQIQEQKAQVDQQGASLTRTLNGPRREEVARARASWSNAETERRRQEALLGQGLASRQQYDAASTAARTALESYQELARGNRAEDIAQARAALRQAEDHLSYLQRQKEELVVRAPADGVIQSFDLRPGDLVAPNQPVASLLEPEQIWVRVYVPEPSLGRVRMGQRAEVSVDTSPKRTFPGRVVEIRPQAEYTPRNIQTLEQRMDQVFGVKVAIDPVPELKPGMAASVRLIEK